MKPLRFLAIVFAFSLSVASGAEPFDGSKPLACRAEQGHDCHPKESACSPIKPESKIEPVFGIDFAKQEVRSPFREALLHVSHTTTNREALVLQGADLLFAWSALVNKTTGAMIITVADRQGAYVVFGQCKLAEGQ
jgi:hypothetical protein